MTDYLEWPEEQENALLEQAKRLEQVLSALIFREEGGTEGTSARFENREERGERPPWETKNTEEAALFQEKREEQASLSQVWTAGQTEPELPLLEQLRQLDRAWSQTEESAQTGTKEPFLRSGGKMATWSEAEPGAGRGEHLENFLSRAGRESDSRSGGREPMQSCGELTWAEQADRAFRRDSRRYDSGFYLY